MFAFIFLCLLTNLVEANSAYTYQKEINLTDYYRMPDITSLADYDRCMALSPDRNLPAYCVVNTYIMPDASSELYNYIREFSNLEKQHFRHDKLHRGICVANCLNVVKNLGSESKKFYVENFPMDSNLTIDNFKYRFVDEDRLNLDEVLNICVNWELAEYNLSGYSTVDFCMRHNESIPTDWIDYAALLVILMLVSAVLFSTFYDAKMNKNNEEDFYLKKHKNQIDRIFSSFSLKRNWKQLTEPTKPEVLDLRAIDGAKILATFFLTFGHVNWTYVKLPAHRVFLFLEQHLHYIYYMIVVNFEYVPLFFFVVCGFFLTINLHPLLSKNKNRLGKSFISAVIIRYIRLTPLVAFFLMLDSTWFYRFGSGILWKKINFGEREYCRKNWWKNLLLISNYFNNEEYCNVQNWFVAADFHLFIVGTIILILIAKWPRFKKLILTATYLLTIYILAKHILDTDLISFFVLSPEFGRYNFIRTYENQTNVFNSYYAPSHLNAVIYVTGMIVGFIYLENKEKLLKVKRTWRKDVFVLISFFFFMPVAFLSFPMISTYYNPSIWTVVYGVFMKQFIGISVGIGLLGAVAKLGWIFRDLVVQPVFTFLARLSYTYYVTHFFVIRLLMDGRNHPLEYTGWGVFTMTFAVFMIGYLISIVLALCIEFPITNLVKEAFALPQKIKK